MILATIGSSFSGLFVRVLPELNGWQINCWRSFWMSASLLIYLTFRYGSATGEVISEYPSSSSACSGAVLRSLFDGLRYLAHPDQCCGCCRTGGVITHLHCFAEPPA